MVKSRENRIELQRIINDERPLSVMANPPMLCIGEISLKAGLVISILELGMKKNEGIEL